MLRVTLCDNRAHAKRLANLAKGKGPSDGTYFPDLVNNVLSDNVILFFAVSGMGFSVG